MVGHAGAVAGLVTLGVAGCSSSPLGPGQVGDPCVASEDCVVGLYRLDGRCAELPDGGDGDSDGDTDGDSDGDICPPERACGARCCPEGQLRNLEPVRAGLRR